jgi:acyl carrier protein
MKPTLNPTMGDEVRAIVKEIVTSIKPLDNGLEDVPDDAPLFDDEQGEPSPVGLDSLDMLDLALAIGERFDLNEEQFDLAELDLQSLRTVNDIVDFILTAAPEPTTAGSDAVAQGGGPNGE